MEQRGLNLNGGLTIVAMPGFETIGGQLKQDIETIGASEDKHPTPTDLVIPSFDYRANGEPVVRLAKDHIGGHDCVVLVSGPGTYEAQGRLKDLLGYLHSRKAKRITVFFGYPFLPRSDKDEGTEELALFPHVIHQLRAAAYGQIDRIITFDLHNPQLVMASGDMGFITEVSIVRLVIKRALEAALTQKDQICFAFPDEGAQKQFEGDLDAVCQKKNLTFPRIYGTKRRHDDRKAELLGFHGDISAVKDTRIIVVDDEITTANTNIKTSRILKEQYGAKVSWSAAVHGVMCGGACEALSAPDCLLEKIFVSDSIPFANRPQLQPMIAIGRIEVVSTLSDRAEVIYHHHWDINIRDRRG